MIRAFVVTACSPTDIDRRVARAMVMADGNRLQAALILDRWAGVLRANDPVISKLLVAQSKRMVRRDFTGRDTGLSLSRLAQRKHPRLRK